MKKYFLTTFQQKLWLSENDTKNYNLNSLYRMATVIRQGLGYALVYQGYTYKRNQTRLNGIYWKCTNVTYQARLTTGIFNVDSQNNAAIVIRNQMHYNHTSDQHIADRQINVYNEIREAIVADPTIPLRHVYNQQLAQ